MSAYSDAQIAQLIADHAALKDEVAALKGELLREHHALVEETENDWKTHLARNRACPTCRMTM